MIEKKNLAVNASIRIAAEQDGALMTEYIIAGFKRFEAIELIKNRLVVAQTLAIQEKYLAKELELKRRYYEK